MSQDLEYSAAYNFMHEGYYELPGIERPGFLHAADELDAAWLALKSQKPRLVGAPEVLHGLAETVKNNLADTRSQVRRRAYIASEVNRINKIIDQQR
jgi:hypothetical protein